MTRKPEPERDLRGLRILGMLSAAGITLAVATGLGVFAGIMLDRWLKTSWWVMVGALLGIAAGFREFFRVVARANAEQERIEREQREQREQRERQE